MILPQLPPENIDLETKNILRLCSQVHRALGELKGVGMLLPNPSVLINSIPLLEAQSSSEIENIVTTQDKLFQAAMRSDEECDDPMTKEVLQYRTALRWGFDEIKRGRPMTTNLFVDICSRIRGTEMKIRQHPVFIGNPATRDVVYTPPQGEMLLRDLLANLEQFIHNENDGLDPLIKLAVFHYQFEAIHPFEDGNGRTGRVANILYLVEKNLLQQPILYLSHYIIRSKSDYYQKLRYVTEQKNWESWILYMLEGIRVIALETIFRIRKIGELIELTCSKCRELLPSIYSRELIDLLFALPYCRTQTLIEKGFGKRQTSSYYLNSLEKEGFLDSLKVGKEKIYVNRKLIQLLSKDYSGEIQ
jgi:Fic family protein